MTSYVISSSLILVIHDNMINGTSHIVEHILLDISRSHGCKMPHMWQPARENTVLSPKPIHFGH
jgi:hypothetical protein